MKRPFTVSQNVRVFVTAVALGVGAMACGSSGGGGTAGTGGGAGTTGSAGTGGTTPCTLTDVQKIFTSTATPYNTGCTVMSACHDASGAAAGLDFVAGSGWETKLVGKGPMVGAGTIASKCANMNLVYLKAGSNPASGLFIDKLDPNMTIAPCGDPMPNLPPRLTDAQFACVKSWATTLTAGH